MKADNPNNASGTPSAIPRYDVKFFAYLIFFFTYYNIMCGKCESGKEEGNKYAKKKEIGVSKRRKISFNKLLTIILRHERRPK